MRYKLQDGGAKTYCHNGAVVIFHTIMSLHYFIFLLAIFAVKQAHNRNTMDGQTGFSISGKHWQECRLIYINVLCILCIVYTYKII